MHPRKLVTIVIETKEDGSLFWRGEDHIGRGQIQLQGQVVPGRIGELGIGIMLRFIAKGSMVPDLGAPNGYRSELDANEGEPLETIAEVDADDVAKDMAPWPDEAGETDAPAESMPHCKACGMAITLCACGLLH